MEVEAAGLEGPPPKCAAATVAAAWAGSALLPARFRKPACTDSPTTCPSAPRAAFDELLAAPAGDDAGAPTGTVVRAAAAYECRDDRFLTPGKDFDRQYAQLYYYRLHQMRAHVEAAAQRAWPGVQGALFAGGAAGWGSVHRGGGWRCRRLPAACTSPPPTRLCVVWPQSPASWVCRRRGRWPLWARCTKR